MRAMAQQPGADAGTDDIQADIERTRQEISDTVGASSARLDVKERTKHEAAETRERVVDTGPSVRHVATEIRNGQYPFWPCC